MQQITILETKIFPNFIHRCGATFICKQNIHSRVLVFFLVLAYCSQPMQNGDGSDTIMDASVIYAINIEERQRYAGSLFLTQFYLS